MATSRIIEEETGTNAGRTHPHNGYWAGDFTSHATSQGPRVLSNDPRPSCSIRVCAQGPVRNHR
jgi:hypothetical protein